MNRNGLTFFPLYWVWHDTWLWQEHHSGAYEHPDVNYYWYHQGHCHFWFMGFSALDADQRAWSGAQSFQFKLQDTWSPRANDPNFQNNLRIVGRPEWYFRIVENWRRVYIQEWDYQSNNYLEPGFVGKRGIRWDASKAEHTNGPFREGKDNFAMFQQMPRTLPLEYWRQEDKLSRDHYLRKYNEPVPDPDPYNPRIFVNPKREGLFTFGAFQNQIDNDYQPANRDYWVLPWSTTAGFNYPDGGGDSREDMARRTAYPDYYYIYPTLEYQQTIPLNWERLPGWQDRDIENWRTGENFGDFFETSIALPYVKDGIIQSPFSDGSGTVYPPGTYCNGVVTPENILKYKSASQVTTTQREFLHPDREGQTVQFYTSGHPTDGKWTEQFLGGTVLAKARVVVEDQWGGRSERWVHSTQYFTADPFEGTDQNAAPPA